MNYARLILMAGLFAGGGHRTAAQRPVVGYSDTVRIQPIAHPRWVVSLAPLALFDINNTVQLGIERMLGGRHSVLGEVGYGPAALNLYRSSLRDGIRETWRGRAEWRIYTRRSRPSSRQHLHQTIFEKPLGNYVALDLFYKQVNAVESGSVGRACEDGPCQYYQRFQARTVKYVGGAHIKVGKQVNLYIPNENSRFVLDMYLGLGLRRRMIRQYGLPEPEDAGSYFINGNGPFDNFWGDTPVAITLSMAYGFRLGYVF